MSAAQSVLSSIQHYQKVYTSLMETRRGLYGLPVTVQHLQDTGVGKTINSLRKSEGEVGEAAKALVLKWKQMVAEESENEQEGVTDRNAHSSHNGGTRNGNDREKSDKRSKGYSEKTSKSHDLKDPTQMDDNKNNKRKRESDSEQEKRHKLENNSAQSTRDPISSSLSRANFNGDNVLDEDWNDPHNDEEMHSEDENGVSNDEVKTGTISFEERNAQSSDDDFNRNEYATNSSEKSWHRSEDFTAHQQNKSSKSENKSKSKKSSSRSDKSKCSSSLRDESKGSVSSNSTRQRDDKSSSGSGSHSNRKDVSNYSEKSEGKSKSKEKNKKGKHKDKHRSKDEKESKDTREKGKRSLEEDEDGVDSFSGKSFGEALGMMFPPEKSRKKSSSGSLLSVPSASKTNKSKSSSSAEKLSPKVGIHSSPKIEHKESPVSKVMSLEVDEDFGLPALNPNYKPLPQPNFFNSPPKRYQNEDEDDLSNIMYSKVQRTKVYSGIKTGYTFVPSLFDLCTRVLQENIDALEYTGGVPFDLLKPVLERANPDQLFTLEHFNPYLIEDTDTFWEYHCKKDFRTTKREEMETWRDMYLRCRDERENKLKSVTANIAAAAKAKALPVRKTQIAFVEGTVKPPRNVARKQAKFGTAHSTSSSPPSTKQSGAGLSSSFTGRSSAAPPSVPLVSVPAPRGSGSGSQSSSCKPKAKAPLMQKTLQFMKLNRFGKR